MSTHFYKNKYAFNDFEREFLCRSLCDTVTVAMMWNVDMIGCLDCGWSFLYVSFLDIWLHLPAMAIPVLSRLEHESDT